MANTSNPANRDGSSSGGPGVTPLYWEAWQVDGAGDVTPVDLLFAAEHAHPNAIAI